MKLDRLVLAPALALLAACGGGTPAPTSTPEAPTAAASVSAPASASAAPIASSAPSAAPTASAVASAAAPTPALPPAAGGNLVDGRPFAAKSGFFVKRDFFGKMKEMFILFDNENVTCELAKGKQDDLVKRDGHVGYAMFLTPMKEGTKKVGAAESATMAQGSISWFFPKTETATNSSGNMSLNSGSITVAKVTATGAEITLEAGDAYDAAEKSKRHYVKGTFPITRCK